MTMYARVFTANCDGETEKQHERKIRTVAKKVDFPVYFPQIVRVLEKDNRGTYKDVVFQPFRRFKKEDGKFYRQEEFCSCGKYSDHGCCFMFPFDDWEQYKKRIVKFTKARTRCGCSILHGDGCGEIEIYFKDEYGNKLERPENLWSDDDD